MWRHFYQMISVWLQTESKGKVAMFCFLFLLYTTVMLYGYKCSNTLDEVLTFSKIAITAESVLSFLIKRHNYKRLENYIILFSYYHCD